MLVPQVNHDEIETCCLDLVHTHSPDQTSTQLQHHMFHRRILLEIDQSNRNAMIRIAYTVVDKEPKLGLKMMNCNKL